MKITFLEAKMALAKQFGVYDEQTSQVIDKAYPKAAKFITHTHEVDNIDQYHEVLTDAAKKWYGLLKGTANRELTDYADRKGLTDRNEKTELLVLDIDGLNWEFNHSGKLTQKDVQLAAEKLMTHLPSVFSSASVVAVASSNFGRKPGLRMHLHYLLETPIQTDVLRGLITMLNFDVPYVNDNLSLTPAGRQIKYPIDPCLADNSRIVYIAPPIFGDASDNPFVNDSHRIVKIHRGKGRLDLSQLLLGYSSVAVTQAKEKRLKQLMAVAGYEYRSPKTVPVQHRGTTVHVLQNPEQMTMEIAEISSQYVRYNINGGDSNAYWVWMDNPEIVYSFKPDELPFKFKIADPKAYALHIERFSKQIEKAAAIDKEDGTKFVPMMVFERRLNAIATVEYDPFEDVVRSCYFNNKEYAENWMEALGAMVPKPIPPYEIIFNPTSNVGHDSKTRTLNTYLPSKLAKEAPAWEGDPLSFGDAEDWMATNTPLCATIILNMVGDDSLCFEQFINWFAFMIQRRQKPETAWVVHGVEGTGKGLFIKRIAKPLLGEKYVTEKKLRDIAEDKYNGYMEEALLLFVDEFNMNESNSAKATANVLKNQITEETLSIRKMQTNPTQAKTYFGMILASNDIDAMRLSPTDRRYNVCPRQETPLKLVLPDINLRRKEYDDRIAAELPHLMSMLKTFQYDEHRVRTPLDNESKQLAAEAGMTTDETFFTAIRRGDLEFFEPLAVMKINVHGTDYAKIKSIKDTAIEWVKHALMDRESCITRHSLKAIYECMTGFITNDISFGRKCKQHGLVEARFYEGELRLRGVKVRWKHAEPNYLRAMLEGMKPVVEQQDNVVGINKGKG